MVLGKCSETMKAKIEGKQIYPEVKNNYDVIKILKIIQDIYYGYGLQC